MRTDFFESDVSLHPYVIMAPEAVYLAGGVAAWRMRLLAQGERRDVAYQITTKYESFRALLRKRALVPGPIPAAPQPMAERFTLEAGVILVLVPCPEGTPSPFMRPVSVVAATPDPGAAERCAVAAAHLALVAEVVAVSEAELGRAGFIRWDRGPVEFPPQG